MNAVSASQLEVKLGETQVLDDISLAATSGEFMCVVGPNGSGKTTLLRTLAGELTPHRGQVTINGADPSGVDPAQRAALRSLLSQTDRTDIPFTVATVVGFGTHVSDLTQSERSGMVVRSMERVEIGHLADRPVSALSSGEQRRTAVARTLAQDAGVLLLDEPTDSLDLGHADMVMRTAADEAHSGATVIVSIHDLNLAARHASRIALLSAGRVVAEGLPAEVFTEALLSDIYDCPVRVTRHPDNGPLIFL